VYGRIPDPGSGRTGRLGPAAALLAQQEGQLAQREASEEHDEIQRAEEALGSLEPEGGTRA